MLMQSIEAYLALRRSLGADMLNEEYLLRSFARFCLPRGKVHVQAQLVLEWAALGPSPSERERRLRTVARFAIHARAEDSRHEVPPTKVFADRNARPLPRIYSEEEIRRLLGAASRLRPTGSLLSLTFVTLFGLLVATGLRISEALDLRLADVTPDGLVIRKTKFHKSRLVPMHPTAESALQRYLVKRRAVAKSDHVFISLSGHGLNYYNVRSRFLKLTREIGLPARTGHRHHRIHDLRHTFAVRALESNTEDPSFAGRHLRALSTYMGHVHISGTYWYLQATPRLTRSIADACEALCEGGA